MFSQSAPALPGKAEQRRGAARLCLLAALLVGCGAGAPPRQGRVWAKSYAFGTLGERNFDTRDVCGERGAARIEVRATPSTVLLSLFTLGMYTPKELQVECR